MNYENIRSTIWIQQPQFSNSFVNFVNILKSQFVRKWEKLRSPTRTTFKNPNSKYFCQSGKRSNYSLRPTFKNPNFESYGELRKAMSQFEFHFENKEWDIHKIRLDTFQT